MKRTQFRRRIETYIRQHALPPDKFSHQPRLYHLARRLARGRIFDDDVLHAAAWMHDLGVFIGHRPESLSKLAKWDHVAYASKEVPKLLKRFGFPHEKIPAVLERWAVGEPAEARFVHDVPRGATVVRRVKVGALDSHKGAISHTLTEAGNARQGIFGRPAKGRASGR